MTHWKKLTNPNYLGAYALEDGKDLILTIKDVREETVTGTDGKKEDCVVCYFYESVKPMILNATNMKMIQKLYKTPYIEQWRGKQIQVGIEKIKAFGDLVDALRVRKVLPKSSEAIKCEMCQGEIMPMGNMTSEQLAGYTKSKYGKQLCRDCATKLAAEKAAEDGKTE